MSSSGHFAHVVPGKVGGDEPAGLYDLVQVDPRVNAHAGQHVEDVLRADVPAGAPGVGAAAQPSGAAVHHRHAVLQTCQDVGQRLQRGNNESLKQQGLHVL